MDKPKRALSAPVLVPLGGAGALIGAFDGNSFLAATSGVVLAIGVLATLRRRTRRERPQGDAPSRVSIAWIAPTTLICAGIGIFLLISAVHEFDDGGAHIMFGVAALLPALYFGYIGVAVAYWGMTGRRLPGNDVVTRIARALNRDILGRSRRSRTVPPWLDAGTSRMTPSDLAGNHW